MMPLSPLKIGLVGEPLTGKDMFAAYLVDQHGFSHIATSDFIRFYILENNLGEPTRPLLKEVANSLRSEHGPDYFAKLALRHDAPRLVISGLRNPHEVSTIKANGGHIIALKASINVRYLRAQKRGKTGDNVSFDNFRLQQVAEDASSNPNAQNMLKVIDMADYVIENNEDRESLHAKIEDFLRLYIPKR